MYIELLQTRYAAIIAARGGFKADNNLSGVTDWLDFMFRPYKGILLKIISSQSDVLKRFVIFMAFYIYSPN